YGGRESWGRGAGSRPSPTFGPWRACEAACTARPRSCGPARAGEGPRRRAASASEPAAQHVQRRLRRLPLDGDAVAVEAATAHLDALGGGAPDVNGPHRLLRAPAVGAGDARDGEAAGRARDGAHA